MMMRMSFNMFIIPAALSVLIALVFFIVSVLAHAFITNFHSKTKRCNSDISDHIPYSTNISWAINFTDLLKF